MGSFGRDPFDHLVTDRDGALWEEPFEDCLDIEFAEVPLCPSKSPSAGIRTTSSTPNNAALGSGESACNLQTSSYALADTEPGADGFLAQQYLNVPHPHTTTAEGSSCYHTASCCQDADLHPCCTDDFCIPKTIACSDAHCNEPNWCDDFHYGACDGVDCEEPASVHRSCPDSFSQYFDLCFQSECAPSHTPAQAHLLSAPRESGHCGGTFVTDTCADSTHRGWDPNCPSSALHTQGVFHDCNFQPYGPNGFLSGTGFPPHAGDLTSLGYDIPFTQHVSPHALQHSSTRVSNDLSIPMGYIEPHRGLNLESGPWRAKSPLKKRIRSNHTLPIASQTTTPSPFTPWSSESGSTTRPCSATTTESTRALICMWILNPGEPPDQHLKCFFHAPTPLALHEHITTQHTRALTTKHDFTCRWHGCDRFLTQHFSQKSKLDRHMQTHDGYMPFSCEVCGKKFITKDQRRNHQATHANLHEWVCEVDGCGKRFNAPTSLRTHMNTHTGAKPYVCWVCGHRDGDSSNNSKHFRARHPGAPRKRPVEFDEGRDGPGIKGYVLEKHRPEIQKGVRDEGSTERERLVKNTARKAKGVVNIKRA